MNINKFTQKSLEAVQSAEKIAYDYGNPEIRSEHLLSALVNDPEGLIPKLLSKMQIVLPVFGAQVKGLIERLPKVQGGDTRVSQGLNKILIYAEDEAKGMGDSYVSVEHLFLALLKYAERDTAALLSEFRITREDFLKVLATVRGNQQVNTDNPEATYDTLEKYGYDLVERARKQKLDPVIGRDSEIRNVIRILSRKT
ncbi:MAG: type VI secretion system ATPase TssH, partial [Lachnospiraceae bacterium]|nr:type VI secretion system ATPase TssH [Lachnospiraceae bacterium]